MKYLKYLFISIIYGLGFTFGCALIIIYGLPLLREHDTNSFYKDRLIEIESRNGITCKNLFVSTHAFAIKDIGNIINVGINGDDWVAIITTEQKLFIDKSVEPLQDCHNFESDAKKLGLEWPEFKDLATLYQALKIYSTRYGSNKPSSRNLKPEALDRLQFEYQNLTSQSTKDS